MATSTRRSPTGVAEDASGSEPGVTPGRATRRRPGLIRRILVPLDLTPLGEVKLPVAEAQARAFNAELILLHVLPDLPSDADGTVSPAEARARVYLETIVTRMRTAGVAARLLVDAGPVPTVVVRVAREEEADLIVIGSNLRTGLSRLFLGSVAEEIVRTAPCPVLLVRPELKGPVALPVVRSFADDAARIGLLAPRTLGLRTVEVARIVGSVGRAHELDADFRPLRRSRDFERRFEGIRRALERGETMPPVDLYKLGYGYYVLDGNHRVAAAKQIGQIEIDANVTEFVPIADTLAQRVFNERRAFERQTGLTRIGATQPGAYERLAQLIDDFAAEQGIADRREAATRWYGSVFRPLAVRIRARRLAQHFPGDRTADILLRVAEYRRAESEREQRTLSWEDALERFIAAQDLAE